MTEVTRPDTTTLAQHMKVFGVERAESGTRSLIHFAQPGVAITIRAPHRRFGTQYCEFLGHCGDGRNIRVSKLISSMYRSRWTKPLKVPFADVLAVHDRPAREQGEV